MITSKPILATTILLVLFTVISCNKDDVYENITESVLTLPETPFDYASLNLPSHFTTNVAGQPLPTSINGTDNTPATNPITNNGATLGRVLFYDKKLSANGTIACASCHKQDKGFSDDATLSSGFNGTAFNDFN